MNELHRITVDPKKCGGRPTIRGSRMRVTDILGHLAAGDSREDILESFPYLEPEDITAALQYAAAQAEQPGLRSA